MFATGGDTIIGGEDQVYEVQCDGSDWTQRGNFGAARRAHERDRGLRVRGCGLVTAVRSISSRARAGSALLNGESLGTNPVYLE